VVPEIGLGDGINLFMWFCSIVPGVFVYALAELAQLGTCAYCATCWAHTQVRPYKNNSRHLHDLVGADLCVGPDVSRSTCQTQSLGNIPSAHTGAPLLQCRINHWAGVVPRLLFGHLRPGGPRLPSVPFLRPFWRRGYNQFLAVVAHLRWRPCGFRSR